MEQLLLTIQGIRVSADLENRVMENGFFTVESLYSAKEPGSTVRFPRKIIWSPFVPPRVGFFALGSLLGESFNFGSTQKEGSVPCQ